MDPNTFGSGSRMLSQFGSGSISRVIQYALSILKEIDKNNFREKKIPLKKGYFLTTIRTKCHLQKFVYSVETLNSEFKSKILHLFTSSLSYFYMCGSGSGSVFGLRFRIQEAHECGSNMDPDPQHCGREYKKCV